MAARQSVETAKALRMVARGTNMHQAAIRCGIAYSTIFRACKALKNPLESKDSEIIKNNENNA